MFEFVLLGRYMHGEQFLYKLDPRVKIGILMVLFLSVFLIANMYYYLFLVTMLLLMLQFNNIPFFFIMKGLKPLLFLMFFLSFFYLFTINEGTLLFSFGFLKVYSGALRFTFLIFLRLFIFLLGSLVVTLSTKETAITYGISFFLTPLKWVRFPVNTLAFIIGLALRFVPTMFDEAYTIRQAQISRGAHLEKGKLHQKIRAMVSIFIPLLLKSIDRAEDLANILTVRGFHPESKRTAYYVYRISKYDYIAILCCALVVGGSFFLWNM